MLVSYYASARIFKFTIKACGTQKAARADYLTGSRRTPKGATASRYSFGLALFAVTVEYLYLPSGAVRRGEVLLRLPIAPAPNKEKYSPSEP